MRLPLWLKKEIRGGEKSLEVTRVISELKFNTICQSAKCPNIGECFSKHTLTFMILGQECTRSCAFCGVLKRPPFPVDVREPQRVAQGVKKLGLNYVVVTSVTRDDLQDGGAEHFVKVVNELRATVNDVMIEILTPDFGRNEDVLKVVLNSKIDVFAHNIETVKRLYPKTRPHFDYEFSVNILKFAKNKGLITKSSMILGLGETEEEVFDVMQDLRGVGCDILALGQYLPPSRKHITPVEFIPPSKFEEYREKGIELGFSHVTSGPFVRSSYRAKEAFNAVREKLGTGMPVPYSM